jgi:hypothetical protein
MSSSHLHCAVHDWVAALPAQPQKQQQQQDTNMYDNTLLYVLLCQMYCSTVLLNSAISALQENG